MESSKEQISAERKKDEEEEDERKSGESSDFRCSPYRRRREDLSYVICDFIQPPYQMIVWEKKKPF